MPPNRTRTRPTRLQKREANRQRILAAARAVFGARGYHAATIEDIADEAGLSNGAIYYNFGSKEDLFLTLLDDRLEERLEHLRATLGAAADPAADPLPQEARDVTRSFKESREWRLLLLEFIAYAARNPRVAPKLQAHQRKLRAALADAVDTYLRRRGIAPPMPVDELAIAISGLADGLALEELADPGSVPDELLGHVLTLMVPPGAPDRPERA
jgi:AcrR family transcriptional regulator